MTPSLLPAIATFAVVARHASFTRAALELGVSPSALSQSVSALERQVGVRLLDRSTRRVRLTELGRQFLDAAAPALAQLQTAVTALDEGREAPSGVLRLNVSAVAAQVLLVEHLGEFHRRYPQIRIDLHCENRMLDLVAGGFDAGLRLGENLAQDVIAVPLGPPQRLACFASPGYLRQRPAPRSTEALRDHPCLALRLSTGSLYRWEFVRDGEPFELAIDAPALICNDNRVLLAAARAGAGIGIALEGEVAADFAAGLLTPVLEEAWAVFPGFHLYYPSRAQMPRKLRAFIDFMRERLGG